MIYLQKDVKHVDIKEDGDDNMLMGVVFKDGKEIDRGIKSAGKHWVEKHPEQNIEIYHDSENYNPIRYQHGDGIYFQELQDNGNGWEIVYDSNERIDRTVEYPLPRWFTHCEPIPDYSHKINKKGTVDSEFKGYIR